MDNTIDRISFFPLADFYNSMEMALNYLNSSDVKLLKNKYNRIKFTSYPDTVKLSDLTEHLKRINTLLNNEMISISIKLIDSGDTRLLIHNNIFSLPISGICYNYDYDSSELEDALSYLNLLDRYHIKTDIYEIDNDIVSVVSLECKVSDISSDSNINYLKKFTGDIIKYFNIFTIYYITYPSFSNIFSIDLKVKYTYMKLNLYINSISDDISYFDSIIYDIINECKTLIDSSEMLSINTMENTFNQYLALLVYMDYQINKKMNIDNVLINHIYIKYISKLSDEISEIDKSALMYQALLKIKHVLADLSDIRKEGE